jgi:ATP-binding cassette subfamily B protein
MENRHAAANLTIFGVLWRAGRAWRQLPRLTILTITALLVQQLFHTAFALSLKLIIDNVLAGTNNPPLGLIITGLLLAFVVVVIAILGGESVNAQASAHIGNGVRRQLYLQLQRLSAGFFVQTKLGDILTRFGTDLKALEAGYTQAFLNTILTVISLGINLPLLFYLDWRLALVTVALLPTVIILTRSLVPRSVAANYAFKASEGELVNTVQESVRAQQVIKTFGLENLMTARFDEKLSELRALTVHTRLAIALVGKTSSLVVLLIQLLITVLGADLAFRGVITAGSLVAFITILGSVTKDIYEFAKKVVPTLIEAAGGIQRIEELLLAPVMVVDVADACALPKLSREITFEQVTFSYSGEKKNLNQLNLTIPAGQSVAFVGSSGSGKSTVLSLLMRFYEPETGHIRLDGIDIRQASQQSLRQQMSAVFQDNFLFNTTIMENIRLGQPSASDEEVIAAACAAEIHDLIASLPDGYHSLVGEAGGRLSGGQRQRLAIARAILSQPTILLLDEATSALDPGTEAAINEMLVQLAQGRTVISVTHRLASAQGADQIFVMHDGQLHEHGTHADLLAQKGIYHELWQKQSGFEVSKDGRQARVEAGRLRHVALFASLDEATLEQVVPQFRSEYFEAGQIVFNQGEAGDKFYLIVRGQVEVLALGADGQNHALELLEDGDHFGEMSLLQDRPRNATIRTVMACLFLTISQEQFLQLVARLPQITPALERRIAQSTLNLQTWQQVVGQES